MDLGAAVSRKFGQYKVRGKEWVFEACPFCRNRRWNFQMCPSLSVYKCWVCGSAGGISKLVKEFGILDVDIEQFEVKDDKERSWIDLEEWNMVVMNKGCLATFSWKNYFEDRGVDEEDLALWGMRFKDNQVLFPFFENKELKYWLIRNMIDNKWYQPKGWSRSEFPVVKRGVRMDKKIVIVEGVMDAVKVSKLGFTVMLLGGTHMYDADIDWICRAKMEPVVCLDSDVPYWKLDKLKQRLGSFAIVDIDEGRDPGDMLLQDLLERIEHAKLYGLSFHFKRRFKR